MFALVDCNSFYASCERLFRPELIHTPIVVLSNNDGCVIARCDQSKAMGIKMGDPYFKIKDELKQKGIKAFSSNYTLYGDLSKRVMNTLSRFSPNIEVYSIDEAFLDLKSMSHFDLNLYCHQIRETVLKNIGIPTCVGVAPTKALAKASNHVAKKFKAKTGGVFILDTPEKILKCLKWLPIEDVWGIGRKYSEKLKFHGVKTAYDFTLMPPDWVRKNFTIVGLRLQNELKGESCLPLESFINPKQSICTSRSFGKMLSKYEQVETAVSVYASRCARKLRAGKLCATNLIVFIHTNPHRPGDVQRSVHATKVFKVPTSDTLEIVEEALFLLKHLWKDGYLYKKAGVIVTGNVDERFVQGDLFDIIDRNKSKQSMKAFDTINLKYGHELVHVALASPEGDWKLRRDNLSPCYTTNWDDLMIVHAH